MFVCRSKTGMGWNSVVLYRVTDIYHGMSHPRQDLLHPMCEMCSLVVGMCTVDREEKYTQGKEKALKGK